MAKSKLNVSTKELTGAQTEKPNQLLSMLSTFGVSSLGNLGQPGKPTFKTYRAMRENPTVALARMVATAPIRTAEWTLEADDGVPDEQIEFIRENLTALWHNLVNDSLLALDYGYAPGEVIYEESEGQICVLRVKPLLVDKTTILTDDHGNFEGLKNEVDKAKVELDVSESFLYSYDCEAGNLYGRSRHENIRKTAWCDWQDMQLKRSKYFKKSAGAMPLVHYPDGEGTDSGGAIRPNYELARNIIQSLYKGDGVAFPSILAPWAQDLPRDGKTGPEMMGWKIDFLETKAQHGAEFTDAMKHCESLMMRGWLIPERSATEAQTAGSRADSETAADWAMVSADLTLHDIVQTIQAQIVNPLLVLNFGDKAAGTVKIKRAGLSAPLQVFFRALIQATLGNPANVALLLKLVDINSLVSAAGLPAPEVVPTVEELEETVEASKPQPPGAGGPDDSEEEDPKSLSMTAAVAEVYKALSDDSRDLCIDKNNAHDSLLVSRPSDQEEFKMSTEDQPRDADGKFAPLPSGHMIDMKGVEGGKYETVAYTKEEATRVADIIRKNCPYKVSVKMIGSEDYGPRGREIHISSVNQKSGNSHLFIVPVEAGIDEKRAKQLISKAKSEWKARDSEAFKNQKAQDE